MVVVYIYIWVLGVKNWNKRKERITNANIEDVNRIQKYEPQVFTRKVLVDQDPKSSRGSQQKSERQVGRKRT